MPITARTLARALALAGLPALGIHSVLTPAPVMIEAFARRNAQVMLTAERAWPADPEVYVS